MIARSFFTCSGLSLRAIAEELSETRVPTAQRGKQSYAATVRQVLLRPS